MTSPENPDLPDGPPRVDELFNRALVAQLAEQRAQRETFAEVERKVEALERIVTERLGELSRQLGADGQLEGRIELLEEMIGNRLASVERVVRTELDNRLGAMADRLHHVEQSLGGDDTGARLLALEATVKRRLGNIEEAVKLEELTDRLGRMERTLGELAGVDAVAFDPSLGSRLEDLEKAVADRLAGLEGMLRSSDVVRRLDALEATVAERLSLLEDTVRSEEIGRRLKSLELALDERSGRIEEFVKTSDLEHRIEALAQAVDEQLADLRTSLASGRPIAAGAPGESTGVGALDSTVVARLTGLEGSLRRLQEDTAARLDDLRAASIASEAGILERIVAESQVVGAHFQAIRPVVEAAVAARPEIEQALTEVRSLAEAAREAAADLMAGVAGPPAPPTEGEPSGPYRVEELQKAAEASDEGDEASAKEPEDSVFQPPEETPIPDRRFGLLPRRDR
ncbi:MAG: hypothetical protein AB1679_13010 [Actinomycetota bacterium]|jgi:hypothetical protein